MAENIAFILLTALMTPIRTKFCECMHSTKKVGDYFLVTPLFQKLLAKNTKSHISKERAKLSNIFENHVAFFPL